MKVNGVAGCGAGYAAGMRQVCLWAVFKVFNKLITEQCEGSYL